MRLPGARNEREVRDERRKGASGAAAEHTEPEANVRLPGARNEREIGTTEAAVQGDRFRVERAPRDSNPKPPQKDPGALSS